ncbi:hypothetical protein MRX96_051665 [Rhipicephalus microplus]
MIHTGGALQGSVSAIPVSESVSLGQANRGGGDNEDAVSTRDLRVAAVVLPKKRGFSSTKRTEGWGGALQAMPRVEKEESRMRKEPQAEHCRGLRWEIRKERGVHAKRGEQHGTERAVARE